MITLILGGLCLRIFMSLLDPFLHLWDEQFHALVAKNMMSHPFLPRLINNPVLDLPYSWLGGGNVWLHKQPLFLWIISLSLKLFGVNEFALRLPSVVMSTMTIWFIYQIGSKTLNKSIAYLGALLFATGNFSLEMVSGVYHTDHNDVAFLFFVTGSIYSWVNYYESGKKIWIVILGLFSGMAVLVKWLIGLIVYLGWGGSIMFNRHNEKKTKSCGDLFIGIAISVLLFLPWQIYILNVFPVESKMEFAYSSSHFFEVVEGHSGSWSYYWTNLNLLYGNGQLVPFFILLSLYFFNKYLKQSAYRIFFLVNLFFVYLFFTIAKTKMIAFCYFMSPIIYLSLACLLYEVFNLLIRFTQRTILVNSIVACLLMLFGYLNLNMKRIQWRHTLIKSHETGRMNGLITMATISEVQKKLGNEDYVIFNCRQFDHIPFMFYSNYSAYDFIPTLEQCREVENKGQKIAIIYSRNLPSYLTSEKVLVLENIGYRK